MITVTAAAEAHFLKKLQPHQKVLLDVKNSGCSGLSYDLKIVETLDETLCEQAHSEKGLPFYITKKSVPYLQGLTIDLFKEGLQSRIVYKNPNEKGACGCGESFSV